MKVRQDLIARMIVFLGAGKRREREKKKLEEEEKNIREMETNGEDNRAGVLRVPSVPYLSQLSRLPPLPLTPFPYFLLIL